MRQEMISQVTNIFVSMATGIRWIWVMLAGRTRLQRRVMSKEFPAPTKRGVRTMKEEDIAYGGCHVSASFELLTVRSKGRTRESGFLIDTALTTYPPTSRHTPKITTRK